MPRGALMRSTPEPNRPERVQAAPRPSHCRCDPGCRRAPAAAPPLSLSPAERLNMLSVRSPTTEKMPTAQPNATHGSRRQTEIRGAAARRPAPRRTSPPSAPSQVLPGLTRGASLRRPKLRPAKNAPMSARDHQQQQPQDDLRAAARSRCRRAASLESATKAGTSTGTPHRQREARLVPLGRQHQPQEGDRPTRRRRRPAGSADASDRRSTANSTAATARSRMHSRSRRMRRASRRSRPIPRLRPSTARRMQAPSARRQHEQAEQQQADQAPPRSGCAA